MARLFALVALLATVGVVDAQTGLKSVKTGGKLRHPLSEIPGRASGVTVTAVFPEHPSHSLPLGAKVPVIVGVRNLGSEALNVSLVGGSVNLVQSFGNYMQNLTIQPYNWPVPAGEEMSFPYMFQLDPRLGSVKYQVALTCLYTSAGANGELKAHGDTFFNQTLELADPEGSMDGLSLLAVGVVTVAAAIYFLFPQTLNAKPVKPVAEAAKPVLDKKAQAAEWLAGTPAGGKKATPKKTK